MALAKLSVFSWLVVIPKNIDGLLKTVEGGVDIIRAGGYRPGQIFFMDDLCEFSSQRVTFGIALLADFVADAPEDHRRMIAITTHLRSQILLMPIIEQQVIVILLL